MSDQAHELSADLPAPHARSATELKSIIEAERQGLPFLLWRDAEGAQQIFTLSECRHATLGRRSSNDIVLAGDGEVSRTHAELELIGEDWTVSDDGLSRNGTFVNGKRITQRRRLADGDVLVFGTTIVEFRAPGESSTAVTSSGSYVPKIQDLTRDAAEGPDRALPPVQGGRRVRDTREQPADRRRGVPRRRRRQESPAASLPAV